MRDKLTFRNLAILMGAAFVLLLLVTAFAGPLFSPRSPSEMDLCRGLSGPSIDHPLGQDKHGRDVLARLIYGARVSVMVGVGTVFLSAFVGYMLGAFAGILGGFWDNAIMRLVDILLAFPGILLAIALTAVSASPGVGVIILALSARGWVGYARVVRGQVLVEREQGYVEAARALGARTWWIAIRHLFPNTMTPVVIQATFGMAGAILAEASLSFLGLGPQDVPTWGGMLSDGTSFLRTAPHMAIFPGIAIMATVLSFNFLGDALRDRLAGERNLRA